MSENTYSKISKIFVTNFMSIRHAEVAFDDQGIVKVLGYNDIGKSAVLRALGVALLNKWPQKQKSFISDDARYFQVDVLFDDDVTLRYEKHDAGSSLYELYQGSELMFTTKLREGLYEKVVGVPAKVSDYLGMMSTPDGINLNYGINTDKQLLVETRGSENYKAINTVLRSDEIYRAVSSINNDNNQTQAFINKMETETYGLIQQMNELRGLDKNLLYSLEEYCDGVQEFEDYVQGINNSITAVGALESVPRIPSPEPLMIDMGIAGLLEDVLKTADEAESIAVPPEVERLDEGNLHLLTQVLSEVTSIQESSDGPPEVQVIEVGDLFSATNQAVKDLEEYSRRENLGALAAVELAGVKEENTKIVEELRAQGEVLTTCPNCGELHLADAS